MSTQARHRLAILALTAVAVTAVTMAAMPAAHADDAKRGVLRELSDAFSSISKQATPAVVFIQVEKDESARGGQYDYNNPFDLFGEDFMQRFFGMPGQRQQRSPQRAPRQYRQMGQGSGFLISKDGYILTNNHVVGDADRITVTLSDGRTFSATRVGSDEKSEVAVIRIEGDDFPFLKLGDSDELAIGEWVLAIGNPFGLAESVTAGIVSAKGRSNMGIADYENFIQTDAAINPGNSGGPLLNIDGQVVGINTAIYSRSGGYMGIGFAVPINMASTIKDQLVSNGKVVRGYLGVRIQNLDKDIASSFGLDEAQGILVSEVVEDSAADKGGLEEGDVIVSLDGDKVEDVNTFRNQVASRVPGTEITLGIMRDGKARQLKMATGELPGEERGALGSVEEVTEELGLSVVDVTPEIARQTGYEEGEGVVVSDVALGGAAWHAGIRQGTLIMSINRRVVRDMKDFSKVIRDAEAGEVILLKVRDGATMRYLTLRVE